MFGTIRPQLLTYCHISSARQATRTRQRLDTNQSPQADAPSSPSPPDSPSTATSGKSSSLLRASSPPGGPRSAIRRRAAADHKESVKNARPSSTRAAGAGGSSGTMLRLYTDESPGLKVDPMVILFLSLGFIFSVVALHCKSDLYPAVAKRDRGFMLTPRRSDCETDETILVRTVTEGDRDVSGYDSIQVRVKQGRQESRH